MWRILLIGRLVCMPRRYQAEQRAQKKPIGWMEGKRGAVVKGKGKEFEGLIPVHYYNRHGKKVKLEYYKDPQKDGKTLGALVHSDDSMAP